jgi:hypothetical protein
MTEREVFKMLEARYSGNDWAIIPQVPNGTGAKHTRTADAIAMSLWPSRGLEIHGFEIKVSRSDWLKELNGTGKKAEEVAKYCDRWWIVVSDAAIVKENELPKTWGLMVKRGATLAIKTQAPLSESVKPIDRAFMAGVLRACNNHQRRQINSDEERCSAVAAATERGIETGKTIAKAEANGLERRLNRLEQSVSEFEKASGIKINCYGGGELGRKVAIANAIDEKIGGSVISVIAHAEESFKKIRQQLNGLTGK